MTGRLFKIFLPVITVFSLFVFGALLNGINAGENYRWGSIRVCKVVVDEGGKITDGAQFPGTKFEISGINPNPNSEADPVGVIGTSTFNTPLDLNADLLFSDKENDAQCITYDELKIGGYFYGVETITSPNSWASPKYNDQFTVAVMDLDDFFSYDGNLFDGNSANDDARNKNADGHIVLSEERPDRTLVVLNVAVGAPRIGGGGPSLGGAQAPQCPIDDVQKVDQVWFSDVKAGEATVHWANKGDAYGYHIAYGPTADNMLWGVEVAGDLNMYTLKNLPGGDLYVKIMAKSSKDCGGPTSDPFKVTNVGGQVLGASTLAETGVFENLMLFTLGAGVLSLGLWQALNALRKESR